MDSLIIYHNGVNKPGVTFETANGFVSRVVHSVANAGYAERLVDAQRVADLLNAAAKADAVRRELFGDAATADESQTAFFEGVGS